MKGRIIGMFILCVVAGFSLVFVARGTDGMPMYVSPKTVSDYKTNIETEKKDFERIKGLLTDAEAKLSEYQILMEGGEDALKNKLYADMEYYKMQSGEAAVEGNGVVVLVDDGTRDLYEGENPNNTLVHDRDILGIINELKRSGAEAISVNGQRLINTSAVSCAGYTIRINGRTYARPFEIKAVGDAKRMSAALVAPEGIATILKSFGVICKVTVQDEIVVPKYEEEQVYQYAAKVVEKEGGSN